MMTLKFRQNTKMTHVLTGRRPVRPVADDDFEMFQVAPIATITYTAIDIE